MDTDTSGSPTYEEARRRGLSHLYIDRADGSRREIAVPYPTAEGEQAAAAAITTRRELSEDAYALCLMPDFPLMSCGEREYVDVRFFGEGGGVMRCRSRSQFGTGTILQRMG